MDFLPAHLVRAVLGFALGAILGTVASARSVPLRTPSTRTTPAARAWLLETGIAILGTQLLESGSGLDLTRSSCTGPRLEWGAMILGGAMFGFGMALVGTWSRTMRMASSEKHTSNSHRTWEACAGSSAGSRGNGPMVGWSRFDAGRCR
ncbi:Hypothetical protein MexAM1_META2p1003 (plasmid) [Methylorubrum extorquens AM1]|uniref:Uncharacterized protein n=1 Tax=Methylorubrum extorquens (strain ATCC 14718 / DSM 1338 / JCM 2805 / NCIMB 9133 / AM1) TaxID=272630 RepID=C5B5R4_METEA|nr:Hypothetical protein MexAM1_META2p1003 [Methylorubrum extorquens AM1]